MTPFLYYSDSLLLSVFTRRPMQDCWKRIYIFIYKYIFNIYSYVICLRASKEEQAFPLYIYRLFMIILVEKIFILYSLTVVKGSTGSLARLILFWSDIQTWKHLTFNASRHLFRNNILCLVNKLHTKFLQIQTECKTLTDYYTRVT